MQTFFPQGPVDADVQCSIGHWDSTAKILYILTDVSTLPNTNPYNSDYIFERAISFNTDNSVNVNAGISDRILVFKTAGSTTSFTLSETLPTPSGYFGYKITGNPQVAFADKNSVLAPSISASQSIYAEWGDPTIFLAGANYQFSTIPDSSDTNPIPIKFYLSVNSDGTADLLNIQPFIIPLIYYFNCTPGQYPFLQPPSCQQNNSTQNALLTVFCSLSGSLDSTACTNQVAGWTTPSDASQAHPYNYCPTGTDTCQPNCKAPCDDGYDSCTWVSSSSQFSCTFDPNVLFLGEWWKKSWFIATMVIIGLLFIIFTALIIKTLRDK